MAASKIQRDFEDETNNVFKFPRKRARISFAAVIKEAMFVQSMQKVIVVLEPTLRRLMQEEAEKAVLKALRISQQSSVQMVTTARAPQPQRQPLAFQLIEDVDDGVTPSRSTLRLAFVTNPPKNIFTNTKIRDDRGNPLQLELVYEASSDDVEKLLRYFQQSTLKIELVMVEADFPESGRADWTAEEFSTRVVKEREGRRPLLTGIANNVVMMDGMTALTLENLVITDNSSWIPSGKFRIGARVAPECCEAAGVVRIKEAITEDFKVKDHRGESYKKSYPPLLSDEVWRLEKIAKNGKFHNRLSDNHINTVQDLFKLYSVDPASLRKILRMQEKMLEVTMNHANTCNVKTKLFVYRGTHATLLLNPVCSVECAIIDGIWYETENAFYGTHKAHVDHAVLDAYNRWAELEEVFWAENMMPKDIMHMLVQQPMIQQTVVPVNSFPTTLQNDVNVSPSVYHQEDTPAISLSASFDLDICNSTVELMMETLMTPEFIS